MSHNNEERFNVWIKTSSWFQKWMRNLVNFNAGSGKSENLHFDVVLLLTKACKVWDKKVQKNYLSWNWKKI